MDFETITVEREKGGVCVLTLNRPGAKNALSIQLRREISAALDALAGEAAARCLIITGAGGVFSAGFDLKEFSRPELHGEIFEASAKYHRDVWNFPRPVIAAVDGAALGGGFDLATLCDIRICAEGAFFAHPEIKFGAPPLFTPLRWLVGSGVARNLCLTGRKMGAEEALRTGLVSEVTARESLAARAREIAAEILKAPDAALACAKRYMVENEGRGFEESFAVEHDEVFRKYLLKE